MKLGIPKEIAAGEARVGLIPADIKKLVQQEHQVLVERQAGMAATFTDEAYQEAGATIVDDPREIYESADLIIKVQPPMHHGELAADEQDLVRENGTYVGFMAPFQNPALIDTFRARQVTSFAMEFIPRITRAQSMDALSSMATIAGYKAVLLGAQYLPKIFPLLMTAAGTVPPSSVLVLGVGVAGLQAIATAKRLGAKVEAFDPRPAVKEQVLSLGAKFVEMELEEDVETKGGYAKEQSDAFLKREQEVIGARLPKIDIVITTAQIFGKQSPVLITREMVSLLKPGSVIVDIAAEQGGNCELTVAGETVEHAGVSIIGAVNLPSTIPAHASQLYSRNVFNLITHLFKPDQGLDFEDEIAAGACITRGGEMVNEFLKQRLSAGGNG